MFICQYIDKVQTTIDSLLIIWKSDLSDKTKGEFFLVIAEPVL